MKKLIKKYERISARQFLYSVLTLLSMAAWVLMWFICGDYGEGKLFVLVVGVAWCAMLAAWVVCLSIQKKIAMRAILRSLGVFARR